MNQMPKAVQTIEELRKLWQQALEVRRSYQSVEDVLTRLERKYLALAKSAGE